jgi:hypothetical protein
MNLRHVPCFFHEKNVLALNFTMTFLGGISLSLSLCRGAGGKASGGAKRD